MPREAEDRVGKTINGWLIEAELERGMSLDHGKIRAKTRNFKIKCTKCGGIKDKVAWKNIYYDIVKCMSCTNEHMKKYEGFLKSRHGYTSVGKIYKNSADKKFEILTVRAPRENEYKFKTIIHKVKCLDCKTEREIIYQSLISGDFVCKVCNKNKARAIKKSLKFDKVKWLNEMEDEFKFMLELHKQNGLIPYLKIKFPDERWDLIENEEE